MARKASLPVSPRASEEVAPSPSLLASDGGIGQPVPPQPVAQHSWFARTCQRLGITNPDQIVAFAHSPSNVTVKLADGSEYCLMKAQF